MTEKFYIPWENQVDQSFKEHAACRGLDPDMFMPGIGEPGKSSREFLPLKAGHAGIVTMAGW